MRCINRAVGWLLRAPAVTYAVERTSSGRTGWRFVIIRYTRSGERTTMEYLCHDGRYRPASVQDFPPANAWFTRWEPE